jgi:leucyl-tRNA synthetase
MFLLRRDFSRPKAQVRMTPDRYNAREAEPRWQKVWDQRGIFANDDPRHTSVLDRRL